jgi:predicted nucleic acid-binding protein
VPHVIDLEVLNSLRKMQLSKRIDAKQAADAISVLKDLPLIRVDISTLTEDIWKLRDNFTAYDAAYVALAQKLEAPLMTHDERVASHAKRFVTVA